MNPDRRADKRGPASFSVLYKVLDPIEARQRFGETEKDGIAEDVSVGGLSLSGGHPIPAGAVLSIRFRAIQDMPASREEGSRKFELRGEARYSNPAGSNSYRTGVRFGKLTNEERSFIAGLV